MKDIISNVAQVILLVILLSISVVILLRVAVLNVGVLLSSGVSKLRGTAYDA